MNIDRAGAVVTGGASGLGGATARELAKRGARVAIFDLPTSQGEEMAKELGGGAIFCPTDVSDDEQVEASVSQVAEAFGSIQINVNCAGIGWAERTLGRGNTKHSTKGFRKVLDVNLIGTFNVLRACAEKMAENDPNEENERGVIINTASIAAYEGQIGQLAYAASKGGIVAMTLPIARDLSKLGIRACTIAPGLFKTPLLMGLPDDTRAQLEANIPFPSRLGEPPEYASLACHIVENPMLNGEVIRLDGALRMQPR